MLVGGVEKLVCMDSISRSSIRPRSRSLQQMGIILDAKALDNGPGLGVGAENDGGTSTLVEGQ